MDKRTQKGSSVIQDNSLTNRFVHAAILASLAERWNTISGDGSIYLANYSRSTAVSPAALILSLGRTIVNQKSTKFHKTADF